MTSLAAFVPAIGLPAGVGVGAVGLLYTIYSNRPGQS